MDAEQVTIYDTLFETAYAACLKLEQAIATMESDDASAGLAWRMNSIMVAMDDLERRLGEDGMDDGQPTASECIARSRWLAAASDINRLRRATVIRAQEQHEQP